MIADFLISEQECQSAFDELSAQNSQIKVQTPAGNLTHLAALVYIITHASEEYGQLAIWPDIGRRKAGNALPTPLSESDRLRQTHPASFREKVLINVRAGSAPNRG